MRRPRPLSKREPMETVFLPSLNKRTRSTSSGETSEKPNAFASRRFYSAFYFTRLFQLSQAIRAVESPFFAKFFLFFRGTFSQNRKTLTCGLGKIGALPPQKKTPKRRRFKPAVVSAFFIGVARRERLTSRNHSSLRSKSNLFFDASSVTVTVNGVAAALE